MRLRNVKKQQRYIQGRLWCLAMAPAPAELTRLAADLHQTVQTIETLCAEQDAQPAALPLPSRQAYAWMKFLTLGDHLERHVVITGQAQRLAAAMLADAPEAATEVTVHLTDYSGLYKYVREGQHLSIQLSEGFLVADAALLQAALTAIFSRQTGVNAGLLRAFSQTEAYGAVVQTLARLGSDAMAARGQYYNLQTLFTELNRDYFQGQLEAPQLIWSQRPTRRKLGHYEGARDRVVLSRSLDSPQVPRYVVAYVLYHELLHKHCGLAWQRGRQRAHTREFRAAERQFRDYEAAIAWLQQHSLASL